jgi:uncharacterized protein YfaS (alpha-2-macroglobulin family)
MKRLLLTLLLLLPVWGVQAFEDLALAVNASQYRQRIVNAHAQTAVDSAAALNKAERYASQKLWAEAIAGYEDAVAGGADNPPVWLRLSQAWQARGGQEEQGGQEQTQARERALQAAYNAYRTATTPDQQARALFILGDLYVQQDQAQQAMAAFKEGLGLEENPAIAQRYQQLVQAHAFQVKGVEVESDSAIPRICLRFSANLQKDRQLHYEDYLVIQPAIQTVVSVQENRLCVTGVSYGQSYEITVRPGIPSASGEKTTASTTFTTPVEDRQPTLGFRGSTYILPRLGEQSLPLISVNVATAHLKLLRINDRNLTQQINEHRLTAGLYGYDIKAIANRSGELLWEGKLDLPGERNQEVTTAIPLGDILQNTQPGIYVLAAESTDQRSGKEWKEVATQWLVVSDLGLSTFRGEDGLHVFLRSLDSARPLDQVDLRLYARNNSELGRAVSAADGHARFDPGLLRGSGGREPAVVMAYGANGDFNFLDLTRPAFDLNDRGVAGREAPGPVDAFLSSERGVYRPGETVELMALLRDNRGYALENLPLVLKIIRPDEVELERRTLKTVVPGGYHTRIALADNVRTGTWTVRAYTDPNAGPVGQLSFQVEDFVPQRLALELITPAKVLIPGEAVTVELSGRFLYGAPAAHLKAEAELVLSEDPDPYPAWSGYRFGLAQESWNAKRYPVALVGTDAEGKASTAIKLDEIPDTTRPLKAELRVSLFEPGGRPVNRSLTLPYRPQPFAIGIRPRFDAGQGINPGQAVAFSVIAVDRTGQPLAVSKLHYDLYREDYDYYWYFTNSRWNYKLILRDSTSLAGQDLSLTAEPAAVLAPNNLDWGRYRLEVFDPQTGIASSVHFQVGWRAGPGEGDTPDQLKVTLDKPRYQPGETAQVHIQAPFAGEVLLTVAGNRLLTTRTFSLPAEGTVVELPVAEDWSPGVYITATAFRPARNPSQRGPGRAVGVAWLGLDLQPRTLTVSLDVPKEVRPRQTLELPVRVTGGEAGKPVWLTLAAVDVGILQLTDFQSPDPVDYFLGKHRLGVDILDIYGKLIEAGGRPGKLQVGGGEGRQLQGPGVRSFQTVALFSGPVAVDEQGQARIPLALPDFNGELRLMAVAWDHSRLGRAQAPLPVRDPLVTEVYLPRFMAPEDLSRLTLNLQNLSAPPGDYRIRLAAEGAVELPDAVDFTFRVDDPAARNMERKVYQLRGREPGIGHVYLSMDGPSGFSLSRQWEIAVRPAQAVATERHALQLPPGQGISVNAALLQGYLPGTRQVDLSFSTRPNLNVPALLARLEHYPYGCLEQTTSIALPLLYFSQVAANWEDAGNQESGLHNRVQQAIQRILSVQRYDGAFGLWNPAGPPEPWLTAYALDFLGRAKAAGYLVPDTAYRQGLESLKQALAGSDFREPELVNRAYALYVLAKADQVPLGELRYLHDNYLHQLPTRLARAQLGAALARYGEQNRAREAFSAALDNNLPERKDWRDYGSPLRDQAAVVALLAEAGMLTDRLPQRVEELAAALNEHPYTSTQEQAWLLLAAQALLKEPGELKLNVNGRQIPTEQNPFYLSLTPSQLEQGINIANQGEQPVWYVVNLSGVPTQILPPTQQGFSITRHFYTQAGKEVDPARVPRDELLVTVITGEATSPEKQQALIVDLLPAGLEIENTRLAHSQSKDNFAWLPELSETLHEEFRDDRYVAALDLDYGQRQFAVAYLVRAVTPGEYQWPAVFVEDMYKPWYFGRGPLGKMKLE